MAKSSLATEKKGLTLKHLIGYGAGDFGGCMTFALMGGKMCIRDRPISVA